MGEKAIHREAVTSQLTMSFNSKEENLLKKKLLTLDTLKKQASDSLSLDQKVLYNRFNLRLRRSELAHARLMGDKEMVRKLTCSMFLSYNSTVSDESQTAVRALLQNGQKSRAASAPCRYRSEGAPLLESEKQGCRTNVDHGKEYKEEQAMGSPEVPDRGPGNEDLKMGIVCLPETGYFPESENRTDPGKGVHFDAPNLNTMKTQNFETTVWGAGYRPHTASVMVASKKKTSGSPGERRSASAFPLSGGSTMDLHHPGVRISNKNQMFSRSSSSTSHTSHTHRPSSRSLFLNTGDIQVEKLSLAKAHATMTQEADFDSKVKRFVGMVKDMQQQGSSLRDYYSDRLLEGTGKKDNSSLSLNRKEEQQRWCLLGEEPNHRSITIKKLDTKFVRKDIPLDILFMESYNLVLTKENRVVRNWPGNDPYHIAVIN